MTISHEIQQFRMIIRSQKCINTNFRLSGAFHMTMQNFCMVIQNQLWDFPLICNTNAFWSISHDCVKFSHDHAKWKYLIFKLSFVISSISFSWFHFNYLQIPVQTNCITSFIMHLDHHQLSLFSSIWLISFVTNLSKSYIEMTSKL